MQYSQMNINEHLDFLIECVVRLSKHLKKLLWNKFWTLSLKSSKTSLKISRNIFLKPRNE